MPVYIVKPETGESLQRIFHHDLLLPCGFLPMTPVEGETSKTKKVRWPKTRQHPKGNSSDETDGNKSQSDPEEYYHDGYGNIKSRNSTFQPYL